MTTFLELGFEPFKFDKETLHSKNFPTIGFTICESDNNTFTISNYDDGNIIARFNLSELEIVNNCFVESESQLKNMKSDIQKRVNLLKLISV